MSKELQNVYHLQYTDCLGSPIGNPICHEMVMARNTQAECEALKASILNMYQNKKWLGGNTTEGPFLASEPQCVFGLSEEPSFFVKHKAELTDQLILIPFYLGLAVVAFQIFKRLKLRRSSI